MKSLGRRAMVTGALSVLVLPLGTAYAEDAKVEVLAEVVLASRTGNELDPPSLAKMKEEFARSGLPFSSFKRLSSQKVSLKKGAPAEIKLPNGKTATLRLDRMEKDTAFIEVKSPPLDTVYRLGRTGSLFIQAGKFGDGMLVLALSPVS